MNTMNNATDSTNATPELPSAQKKSSNKRKLPLIWIIPIITALIGLWLVIQNIQNEGPTFTIRFNNAEGIEPGKTKIRFKDVDIGLVKSVEVTKDRKQVILTAKLVKVARDYLVSDSQFWVVRPHISGGVVSGIGTLLSGPYIGVDVGKATQSQHEFIGLEVPPIVTDNAQGREFILHSSEIGSLDVGSVVSYRRIPAGHVVAYDLAKDGKSVNIKVFIDAPFDQFVNTNTQFWHASGLDLSLDANGFKLDTQSIASLMQGGLAFQTPEELSDSVRVAKDTLFELHANKEQAMRLPVNETLRFSLYFKDTLRGLSVGAPVDFHGIIVGEVKSIGVEFLQKEGLFKFPVEINIYPDRMLERYKNNQRPQQEGNQHTMSDKLVASGMRAQLKTGNLLTGQLYISLDFYPKAAKQTIDWTLQPAILPSLDGGLGELQESVGSILKKIDAIPMQELSGDLRATLQQLTKTLNNSDKLINQINTDIAPEFKNTLTEAKGTLANAQRVLNQDSPAQAELIDALKQVSKSARSVGELADYLERHPESLIRGKTAVKTDVNESKNTNAQ